MGQFGRCPHRHHHQARHHLQDRRPERQGLRPRYPGEVAPGSTEPGSLGQGGGEEGGSWGSRAVKQGGQDFVITELSREQDLLRNNKLGVTNSSMNLTLALYG